ncbi:DUF1330 domain-containing protein [Streptomyces syringium]|uniref:DUF1330 domain-containing protein n=1 Tax=Streptomyces syringium TaxID=76729 RepID=UPI003AAF829C
MTAFGFAHLRSRRHHSDIVEYLERIQATLDPFAGRFVIHGPPTEVLEGDWPGSMVLIGFPTLAEAQAWYDSAAYQDILRLRTDHIEGDVLLIEGVGPSYDPAERARGLRADTARQGGGAGLPASGPHDVSSAQDVSAQNVSDESPAPSAM